MNYRVERTLLALSIALLCALGLFSVARAQDSNAVATTITIEPLDPVVTGTPVAIRAQLHTATNQKQGAVGNETLDLSVDGVHQRRAKTDANGAISFSLPGNLPVGKHTIQIDYAGTQELLPSIAVTELVIAPAGRQPAQAAKTVASVLTIDLINPLSVGEDGTVAVRLSTPSDVNSGAVGNEVIQLFVDDKPVRRARTDADGKVSIHIPKDVELPAGKHTIRAEYPGTHALLRSSSSTELFIAPAVVEIQITPALAGVRFALDKREFVSDQQGVARIEVNRVGDYPLEILPIASTNADSQIEFSRWLDEVFTSYRQVTIPLKGPLHVGFNVYKRVSQRYLDLESKPVDAGRITSLTLKSSQGMAFKLTDNQPRWMLASSIARRTTGLEETKILYSVDSVLVDGSNVVNQSQQRFHAQANDEWPIQLLLYTAQFQSRDALFKFPLGSGIHIEHPDGRVEQVPFGPNAELSIRSLVRGIYRVKVSGAPGISPISPIALSRDQDVQLLVISYLDIAIGAVLAAALGFGLIFIGRPRLFFMLGKPMVLAQSLADAYRSMPRVGGLRPAIRRLTAASANPFALSAATSRRAADVRRFALSRTQSGDAAALPALSSALRQPDDVQTRQPFTASLSALARRIERALRHTQDQPTRRKLSSILAYAFFAALVAAVGGLSTQGAANAPAAPTHAQDTAFVPTALPLIIPAQANAAPTFQPHATTVVAPTTQQAVQLTPVPARSTPVPAQSTPAPARSTPVPAPDTTSPDSSTQLHLSRILNIKSSGEDVAQLQQRLRELGYFTYPTNTGYFGANTLLSITQFQAEQGLQATGIVDRLTIDALNSCSKGCIQLNRTGDNAQ